MKILVVDPWPTVADVLIRRDGNAKPTTGSVHRPVIDFEPDYARAIERLQDLERYDSVVIDPYPAEGATTLGREIIQRLRDTRVTVIVVTASWRIAECVECMQDGAWDFITKTQAPETVADLVLASIEKAAGRRKPAPDKDAQWVHDNFDQLCRDHGGLWIAVEGEKLWAVEETYEELDNAIRKMSLKEPRFWRMPSGWVGRYEF
jgi:CheY-like chemotaxis protein